MKCECASARAGGLARPLRVCESVAATSSQRGELVIIDGVSGRCGYEPRPQVCAHRPLVNRLPPKHGRRRAIGRGGRRRRCPFLHRLAGPRRLKRPLSLDDPARDVFPLGIGGGWAAAQRVQLVDERTGERHVLRLDRDEIIGALPLKRDGMAVHGPPLHHRLHDLDSRLAQEADERAELSQPGRTQLVVRRRWPRRVAAAGCSRARRELLHQAPRVRQQLESLPDGGTRCGGALYGAAEGEQDRRHLSRIGRGEPGVSPLELAPLGCVQNWVGLPQPPGGIDGLGVGSCGRVAAGCSAELDPALPVGGGQSGARRQHGGSSQLQQTSPCEPRWRNGASRGCCGGGCGGGRGGCIAWRQERIERAGGGGN
mmetsp:Transcript_12021/g.38508  ORF Transcript_12021/g.38508 Transcript_12021/m.38508 type:complete len:370 (+) Transcript_12021:630-1739(+)